MCAGFHWREGFLHTPRHTNSQYVKSKLGIAIALTAGFQQAATAFSGQGDVISIYQPRLILE